MKRFQKITKPEKLHVGKHYVLILTGNKPVLLPFRVKNIIDNNLMFTMTSLPEHGEFNCRINDLFKNHIFKVKDKDPILKDKTSTKNYELYAAEGLII